MTVSSQYGATYLINSFMAPPLFVDGPAHLARFGRILNIHIHFARIAQTARVRACPFSRVQRACLGAGAPGLSARRTVISAAMQRHGGLALP